MKKSTINDLAVPAVLALAMFLFLPVASQIGAKATAILFLVIIASVIFYTIYSAEDEDDSSDVP